MKTAYPTDQELVAIASAAASKAFSRRWVARNIDSFDDARSVALVAAVQALRSYRGDRRMSPASWIFLKAFYAVLTAARVPLRRLATQSQPWHPIPDQLPLDDPEIVTLLAEVKQAARVLGVTTELDIAGFGLQGAEAAVEVGVSKSWRHRTASKALGKLRRYLSRGG